MNEIINRLFQQKEQESFLGKEIAKEVAKEFAKKYKNDFAKGDNPIVVSDSCCFRLTSILSIIFFLTFI